MASWISQHLFYFFLRSDLDRDLLIERISDDVDAPVRRTQALFFKLLFQKLPSRNQLDNAINLIFKASHIGDRHTLYSPPFVSNIKTKNVLVFSHPRMP